jgi:chromosome segregation ATPase
MLATIAELERQVASFNEEQNPRNSGDESDIVNILQKEIDEHKAAVAANATRVAELEQAHATTREQLDEVTKSRDVASAEMEGHKALVTRLEQQISEHETVVKTHQDGLNLLHANHAKEIETIKASAQADSEAQLADLATKHQQSLAALQSELSEARDELTKIATQVAFGLGLDVSTEKLQERITDLLADQKALSEESRKNGELQTHVTDLTNINDTVMKELKTVKDELSDLLGQNADGVKTKDEHATSPIN